MSCMEKTASKKGFEIAAKFEVSFEDVASLLESAWQGSAYWATVVEYRAPDAWLFETTPKAEEGKHYGHDYALNPGGAVVVSDMEDDDKRHTLDHQTVARGLAIMAEKYPSHWSDFVGDNADMSTGDVFLQCALLGEVLYG